MNSASIAEMRSGWSRRNTRPRRKNTVSIAVNPRPSNRIALSGRWSDAGDPKLTTRNPTTRPNQRIFTAIDSAARSQSGSEGLGARPASSVRRRDMESL
jgi:hypothetical protein